MMTKIVNRHGKEGRHKGQHWARRWSQYWSGTATALLRVLRPLHLPRPLRSPRPVHPLRALRPLLFAVIAGGCVTAGNVAEELPETIEEQVPRRTKIDYVYIGVTYPTVVGSYMRRFYDAASRTSTHAISKVYARPTGRQSFDLRINATHNHAQYSFIDYHADNDTIMVSASINTFALIELLRAPTSFFPPPDIQLSEEEIIEFYRWQFVDVVDDADIAALLTGIEIEIRIEPRSRSGIPAQYTRKSLLQLLGGDAPSARAEYPRRFL